MEIWLDRKSILPAGQLKMISVADMHPLAVSDEVTIDEQFELEELLDRTNIERSGIRDARLISIMLRSDDGNLYAGLYGFTWGGYCEVKTIWVAEGRRNEGLGKRLMLAAEAEAARRGCGTIVLSTHSFQAPGFYKKLGFKTVATIEDCPVGYSFILLVKQLTARQEA
jgi:ribosomal protein S18 acetylase RimI-like enzyme